MPDDTWLPFLQQSPACHFLIAPDHTFLRILGPCAAILGQSADSLVGRPLPSAWTQRLERVFRGETLLLREHHENATWNISLFPIRIHGQIHYAGGLARESTAWTKAERDLRDKVLSALKQQETGRANVARFLHDTIGQNMTALGLQLDLVRMDLESIAPDACQRLAETQQLLGQMMEQVRAYSYELNPSAVERAGLRPALERLADRARERFSVAVRLTLDLGLQLDRTVANAFYYIAGEALDNAAKHSSCSTIEIAVKSSRDVTFLEVRDNGCGFDPADIARSYRGLGLISMEQHAAEAGLKLSVVSKRDSGTVVRAVLPATG